jgi:hypothetical protein
VRAANNPAVGIKVEWSTDLAVWQNAAETAGVVINDEPLEADVEWVKVYIPRSLQVDGKLFSRLCGDVNQVAPVNEAPVAAGDSASVDEGASVNIDLAANDTDADDGLDLTTITIVAGPANGVLQVNANGTVTYSHNGSETTTDSFTYTIKDLAGAASNTATVSITVIPAPVNDYIAWKNENEITDGQGADSEGDGISNVIEYIIGGDPADRMDVALLPAAERVTADPDGDLNTSDYLLYSYRRTVRAAGNPSVGIKAEWSTNLASPWQNAAGTAGVVILAEPLEPGVETVKVYLPRSLEADGKLFVRLGGVFTGEE